MWDGVGWCGIGSCGAVPVCVRVEGSTEKKQMSIPLWLSLFSLFSPSLTMNTVQVVVEEHVYFAGL